MAAYLFVRNTLVCGGPRFLTSASSRWSFKATGIDSAKNSLNKGRTVEIMNVLVLDVASNAFNSEPIPPSSHGTAHGADCIKKIALKRPQSYVSRRVDMRIRLD
jgi:hypothetical protein